jgi:large subunit ribosomal protein L6
MMKLPALVELAVEGRTASLKRKAEDANAKSLHGMARNLLKNMVIGVSQGFERELEIIGVGYRADVQGSVLKMALGFSHPVDFQLPKGVTAKVDAKKTRITLEGIDLQLLGVTAAKIRSYRRPEPYKGKGVRYVGETVKRKEGKAASK